MLREGLFRGHRREYLLVAAAGGTPFGQAGLGPVPEGYAWYVEAYSFGVIGGAHTTLLALAVTSDNGAVPSFAAWDRGGCIEVAPAAAIEGSDNFANALYVPPGNYLRALAHGGTLAAADVVSVQFQVAEHQIDPAHFMSREDAEAVRAAHEHPNSGLVETAVAGRRAV